MKKPTKKQVINTALFAASFIPAVRGARMAIGAVKVGTKVAKAANSARKARAIEKVYKARNPGYDDARKIQRRIEEETFKALKKRK